MREQREIVDKFFLSTKVVPPKIFSDTSLMTSLTHILTWPQQS